MILHLTSLSMFIIFLCGTSMSFIPPPIPMVLTSEIVSNQNYPSKSVFESVKEKVPTATAILLETFPESSNEMESLESWKENPIVNNLSTRDDVEPESNVLNDYKSEIQRNKCLVMKRMLTRAGNKLEKLQTTVSNVLTFCPQNSANTDLTTCATSQAVLEREIEEFESLVEHNKKYRLDSDSLLDILEAESVKIRSSFKMMMMNSSDHFDIDPTAVILEESTSSVTLSTDKPMIPSQDIVLVPTTTEKEEQVNDKLKNFGRIDSSLEIEELIEEIKAEDLNGSSKIFKLASLVKNSPFPQENNVGFRSKFPTIVQLVVWSKKYQLKFITREEREFKLYVAKTLAVGTMEMNSKNSYPKYQAAQYWKFVPLEGADFFLILNIYRKTILGVEHGQGGTGEIVTMKSLEDQDIAMSPLNFMWRIILRKSDCTPKMISDEEGQSENAPSITLDFNVTSDNLSQSPTQTGIFPLDLPFPLLTQTNIINTTAVSPSSEHEIRDQDEDGYEDCSESLSLSLYNRQFPHLTLDVDESGQVILSQDSPSAKLSIEEEVRKSK